ncbi:hypothetical protein CJ030_MR4G010966 [Morella rubra]|uniref:Uncharacterized protein n=1 Tax=Morella rubra TaxID=262757 RepID=A0A6A1VZ11_9ROSI|nr:hypothetical protein CJ030_MR4G010966 [Morella rubra]
MDRHCMQVTFQFSPDILAAFMGLQRPIGAYPTVEMANKPDAEDIFRTFTSQNVVLVDPSSGRSSCSLFWRILHLIFVYDIEPRAHTTKCPIMRGATCLGRCLDGGPEGMVDDCYFADASVVRQTWRVAIPQYHSGHLACDVKEVGRH